MSLEFSIDLKTNFNFSVCGYTWVGIKAKRKEVITLHIRTFVDPFFCGIYEPEK
jgi:hypothetical protein